MADGAKQDNLPTTGTVVRAEWYRTLKSQAVSSQDKTVRLWDASTGVEIGPRLSHPITV
jgi:hypothetical protein